MSFAARWGVVAAVLAGTGLALAWAAPIAQVSHYHDFADQRTMLGVPHFWNVLSNAAFLAIGLAGLALLARKRTGAAAAWATLFAGAVLVAAGSVYYHWQPSNSTLVWDRAPMAVAFGGFFAALLAEHAGGKRERTLQYVLLPSFVGLGLAAVYWWWKSGDLSAWVFAQAAPMLAVVLVLALLPGAYTYRRYLAYGLACYALAKFFEIGDRHLLQWSSGVMGGHALKHLAAAGGIWCFYRMLQLR